MPRARRDCLRCSRSFQPRHKPGETDLYCLECRTLKTIAEEEVERKTLAGEDQVFRPKPVGPAPQTLSAPMRQAVFDIETWGLNRGWGVVMMVHILVHGIGDPQWFKFDLTQSPGWPDIRSDDSWLAKQAIGVLKDCHILYAHNGLWFDVPFLNSVALINGLDRMRIKMVDPFQIARRKYRLGNSLGEIANALGLPPKMQLPAEHWRRALLDNSEKDWDLLRERCTSDVEILNAVAGRISNDVQMIDYWGSSRG